MDTFKKILRGPFVWLILGVLALIVVINLVSSSGGPVQIPTSQALALLRGDDALKEVVLTDGDQTILITKPDGSQVKSYWVGDQSTSIIGLLNQRIEAGTLEDWKGLNPTGSFWSSILSTLVMLLLFGALLFFLMNGAMGGGGPGKLFSFGRSRAKITSKDTPKTTFADVAGVDEAVEELEEIKEFLAEPGKFKALGAKIPKGVLLYGPPGTGKTLLARAVAGEASVPFFSVSGSEFIEMFVGVGASRMRDLFEQAKNNAPAIIFIDEIDAVGRSRGAGFGGNGEREEAQTLNQLLVEMDGFDAHGGVILIAATNRPDVLDPALLRPGRFDRQIAVDAPDLRGRYRILKVHAKDKPLDPGVDLKAIARRTPGFTGADLANVLNEGALLAARKNESTITEATLGEAVDRVVAGPQKRTRLMNAHELLITAYHEGGHALVASAMPGNDPVQKITILPRGHALGYTMVMPDEDKYSQTRGQLLDQLAYMLGGRAAEELIFHDPTTGASNDIEKATKVARAMVTQYGMTESLGAVRFAPKDEDQYARMAPQEYSDKTAALIDDEVTKLIDNAHQEAYDALVANRAVLDELVRQLLEHETLEKDQVTAIFAKLTSHGPRPAWTGSETRLPSDIPPVPAPDLPEPDLDDDLDLAEEDTAGAEPSGTPAVAGAAPRPSAPPQPSPGTPGYPAVPEILGQSHGAGGVPPASYSPVSSPTASPPPASYAGPGDASRHDRVPRPSPYAAAPSPYPPAPLYPPPGQAYPPPGSPSTMGPPVPGTAPWGPPTPGAAPGQAPGPQVWTDPTPIGSWAPPPVPSSLPSWDSWRVPQPVPEQPSQAGKGGQGGQTGFGAPPPGPRDVAARGSGTVGIWDHATSLASASAQSAEEDRPAPEDSGKAGNQG